MTRARGNAAAITAGERHSLASGTPVFVDDILVTGEDTRLEVRMIDESLLMIGDDSRIAIEAFFFEPKKA